MKLSTKGRYAVMAVADLAASCEGGPVALGDIASRQSIPLSYLEQLIAKMRRAGIVTSVRGPGGGYRLSRESTQIFIAEVVDAVDEPVDVTRCEGQDNCQNGEPCLTHYLWEDLSQQLHQFLSAISLQSLVERSEIRKVADRQDRYKQEASTAERVLADNLVPVNTIT